MNLRNEREFANTRTKLADLERLIEITKTTPSSGQAAEIRSLTRLANQLREELIRYQSNPTRQVG